MRYIGLYYMALSRIPIVNIFATLILPFALIVGVVIESIALIIRVVCGRYA
jgi:hypothetical protein